MPSFGADLLAQKLTLKNLSIEISFMTGTPWALQKSNINRPLDRDRLNEEKKIKKNSMP